MRKEEIFKLWKKVLQGDKVARKEFIAIYKEYGFDHHYEENPNNEVLHMMYIHLYRKLK